MAKLCRESTKTRENIENSKSRGNHMEGRLLGKGGAWNDRSGKGGGHIWLRRTDIRNVVGNKKRKFQWQKTVSCGVFWFWMKCTKMNMYRRTIGQWNKDQKDSAFWKMYQVVIHEDQIAHSKRYEGSKITFEWWMMRDTIATDQSSDDKFLFIFKKSVPDFTLCIPE